MRKKINFFLISFFLGFAFFQLRKTFAEERILPQESLKLRLVALEIKEAKNPFKNYFLKQEEAGEASNVVEAQPVPVEEVKVSPPAFQVQGIIWGGDLAQAIIDNQVFKVGDTIKGAEIIDIQKGALTISFMGEIYKIESPSRLEEGESKDKLSGGEKK